MGFSFSALLLKLLIKIVAPPQLNRKSREEVEYEMRGKLENYSDEYLDSLIKDFREGNFRGDDLISWLKEIGFTPDILLQWLEDEKFLREHRRKYHPESE